MYPTIEIAAAAEGRKDKKKKRGDHGRGGNHREKNPFLYLAKEIPLSVIKSNFTFLARNGCMGPK